MNEETIKTEATRLGIDDGETQKLITLAKDTVMPSSQVKSYLISARPYMQTLFDTWEGSYMKSFTLTSVGIAIGHANVKRSLGEFTDLSIWIN